MRPIIEVFFLNKGTLKTCVKCDSGVSRAKGNKSPSLMHDCFLSYICGEVGGWSSGDGGVVRVSVQTPETAGADLTFFVIRKLFFSSSHEHSLINYYTFREPHWIIACMF